MRLRAPWTNAVSPGPPGAVPPPRGAAAQPRWRHGCLARRRSRCGCAASFAGEGGEQRVGKGGEGSPDPGARSRSDAAGPPDLAETGALRLPAAPQIRATLTGPERRQPSPLLSLAHGRWIQGEERRGSGGAQPSCSSRGAWRRRSARGGRILCPAAVERRAPAEGERVVERCARPRPLLPPHAGKELRKRERRTRASQALQWCGTDTSENAV